MQSLSSLFGLTFLLHELLSKLADAYTMYDILTKSELEDLKNKVEAYRDEIEGLAKHKANLEWINKYLVVTRLFHSFITDHEYLKKMIEPFSKVNPHENDKDLARLGLMLNLRNISHKEGGMFPNQINNELARVLLKGSNDVFLENQSTLAKVLKELEDTNILFRIEGKKNIKHQSPKSIQRKPKAGEARRQGFHVVRKVTSTVEDYERILSNPAVVSRINKNLLEYGKLREVYELFSKDAFDVFKMADTAFYNSLPMFGEPLPEIFRSAGQNELEFHRKEFVNRLLENPLGGLIFMFSLAELENNSE
jgi:hypothetical protein